MSQQVQKDDARRNKSPESADEPQSEPGGGESTAREVGGRKGPDPTRYGDWEKNGRCIDF